MYKYLKRVIILSGENFGHKIKGSVKLIKDSKVTFSVEFLQNLNYNNCYYVIVGDNDIFCEEFSNKLNFTKCLDDNFSFEQGALFMLYKTSPFEVVCYGEYGAPLYDFIKTQEYAKKQNIKNYNEKGTTAENCNQTTANCSEKYDDECIATQNYYEVENNELLFNQTFFTQCETEKSQNEKETTKTPFFNEKESCRFQNYGYYEKIESKIKNLLNTHESYDKLNKIIPNGKFVKINYDENRIYLVGIIIVATVEYICYGVLGEYKNPPNNLKNYWFFIPNDSFNMAGMGHYIIFQNAFTGEIIKNHLQ